MTENGEERKVKSHVAAGGEAEDVGDCRVQKYHGSMYTRMIWKSIWHSKYYSNCLKKISQGLFRCSCIFH